MTFSNLIGSPDSKTADSAKPRNHLLTDPFPLFLSLRVGSGYETSQLQAQLVEHLLRLQSVVVRNLVVDRFAYQPC